MKERGMIFNAEMVRAILDGRKTQTRRIVLHQPQRSDILPNLVFPRNKQESNYPPGGWIYPNGLERILSLCPFGSVGDRLWVRETWADVNHEGRTGVAYRADGEFRNLNEDDGDESDPNLEKYWFANWYPDLISGTEGRWTPSIHMPRWASRITLEITDVRIERVNDISQEDADAEGVSPAGSLLPHYPGTFLTPNGDFATAKVAFQRLWQSIYGEESWNANPWVWVIEFREVK